jgi:hypothetical protein
MGLLALDAADGILTLTAEPIGFAVSLELAVAGELADIPLRRPLGGQIAGLQ